MIYIGHFLYTTNQQEAAEEERRHGEFDLMIRTETRTEALHRFKKRIHEFKEKSSLFEGECRIFLVQMLELDEISEDTVVMTHYKSVVGDPVMPYIGCTNPSEAAQGCRIFDWKENMPEIDGRDSDLFLEFAA
jgi:hypothetical protein